MTSYFKLKILNLDTGQDTYHTVRGRANQYFPGMELGPGLKIVNVMEWKNVS